MHCDGRALVDWEHGRECLKESPNVCATARQRPPPLPPHPLLQRPADLQRGDEARCQDAKEYGRGADCIVGLLPPPDGLLEAAAQQAAGQEGCHGGQGGS